jgi:hypothetical protein
MRHHDTSGPFRSPVRVQAAAPVLGAALKRVRRLFARLSDTRRSRRRAGDIDGARRLCYELLADVPGAAQQIMLLRLQRTQRVQDVLHLRSAMFDVVSLCHGEVVARQRISLLDRWFS